MRRGFDLDEMRVCVFVFGEWSEDVMCCCDCYGEIGEDNDGWGET